MSRPVESIFGAVVTAPHQIPYTYTAVGGETSISLPVFPVTGLVTIGGGVQVPLDNYEIEGNVLHLGGPLDPGDVVYCLFDKVLSPEGQNSTTRIYKFKSVGGETSFTPDFTSYGVQSLYIDGKYQTPIDDYTYNKETGVVNLASAIVGAGKWVVAELYVQQNYPALAAPDGAGMIGVEQPSVISAPPSLNLQKWLDDEVVNLRTRFGVDSSATARHNTDNLQAAYDALGAKGGGRIRLPASLDPYYFAPSSLTETFENFGEIIQAGWGCIVARPGVLLEGDGIGQSIFHIELGDLGTHGIIAASPSGGGFRNFSLRGNGSTGGNSHGIFNANISADPIHQICNNWLVEHMEISDVGSYGLGINNGDITNLRVQHVYIHNVGADGIDTKQRGPRQKNIGMNFSNIVVDGFGMRLTGCAGLDFHGVGQVTNLTVRNPGLTGQTGFRMRTLDPVNEGENARMSHASNILVEAPPANNANIGVFIGSPDCVVQGAVARGVTDGFQIVGNASGAPDRSVISNAHAIDCAQYGFFVGTGVNDATLDTAYAIGCATGFRNQGTRTTFLRAIPVNCTTKFSSSSVAAPNERFIGSDTYGMTEYTSGAGTIIKEPKSDAADVEVRIKPKGASRLALMDGVGNRKIQIDQNGVGFNGAAPAGKATVNAAATDAATTTTLVNQIRRALIDNGLVQ